MARPKKEIKLKEQIRLRTKKLANGVLSLYLDTYVEGKRTYEFLKLYLNPEEGANKRLIKKENEDALDVANAILKERIRELDTYGKALSHRDSKILLVDWIDTFANQGKVKRESEAKSKSYIKSCGQLVRMLKLFGAAGLRLKDVDKNFCVSFLQYLKGIDQPKKRGFISRYGMPLSEYTVYLLYQLFIISLNKAVEDGHIVNNPTHQLKERVELPEDSDRTFLTVDEVKRLMETECSRDSVKNAFLFACFCGLRFSDVSKLRWGDVKQDDEGYYSQIRMVKTKEVIRVPYSDMALKYMGERENDEQLVFDLPSHGRVSKIVKAWVEKAGITKYITFHASRHTYATLTLNAGASIFTTSKLLGHKNIATTKIYAEVLDRSKHTATNATAALFED